MKLCKDCKHARRDYDGLSAEWYFECELALIIDVVTGERKLTECHTARDHNAECGPEGKLFEAKT